MGKLLNTAEASEALGISIRRVVELIAEGKLSAEKKGRDWLIEERALAGVTVYGKAGRPPKASPVKTKAARSKGTPGAKAKTRRSKG